MGRAQIDEHLIIIPGCCWHQSLCLLPSLIKMAELSFPAGLLAADGFQWRLGTGQRRPSPSGGGEYPIVPTRSSFNSQHFISLSLGFLHLKNNLIRFEFSPESLLAASTSAVLLRLLQSISGVWKGAGDTLVGERQPLHSF